MNNAYSFEQMLSFSLNKSFRREEQVIKQMIHGCVKVDRATKGQDKSGIDFWAILESGRKIGVDAKSRQQGCSKYWRQGPEVALELWSVKDTLGNNRSIGWTLDQNKDTELILFTFDISDSEMCFLVSFQLLRTAFQRYGKLWSRKFKRDIQNTRHPLSKKILWQSECVFVPWKEVEDALRSVEQQICRTLNAQSTIF